MAEQAGTFCAGIPESQPNETPAETGHPKVAETQIMIDLDEEETAGTAMEKAVATIDSSESMHHDAQSQDWFLSKVPDTLPKGSGSQVELPDAQPAMQVCGSHPVPVVTASQTGEAVVPPPTVPPPPESLMASPTVVESPLMEEVDTLIEAPKGVEPGYWKLLGASGRPWFLSGGWENAQDLFVCAN